MPNQLKYKPGDVIGLLTIIKRGPNNGRTTQWYCNCQCGNTHVLISRRSLSNKNRIKPCNCGCLNKQQISTLGKTQIKDLSGQRFGKLFVLEATDKRSAESIIYKCKCDCGTICEVRSTSLRNGHTQSCGCLKSTGEYIISQILADNNIQFEKEKTFKNCVYPDTKRKAKFDFWIENKYLLEFDGMTHFFSNGGWNTEINLQKVKKHDAFKNQWCKDNNIPLIRISHCSFDNIHLEDLLLATSSYIYNKGDNNDE